MTRMQITRWRQIAIGYEDVVDCFEYFKNIEYEGWGGGEREIGQGGGKEKKDMLSSVSSLMSSKFTKVELVQTCVRVLKVIQDEF